ncbi:Ig-like domain-containing protein [Streptacidiphilus sp. P02-A3a]|uniref:L,D-transpeptidase n=1 Tax=Streptacidiphilus sp. P02-A3a TaxID=2704468 RepID=UPI0015F78DD6|nr:Ig-like domain-containing protein [Streptacidiphilus sp. P02-A3a]QMU68504.1 L,D-transpeptidase [Streptacidiphilus sp. P02-A3a]
MRARTGVAVAVLLAPLALCGCGAGSTRLTSLDTAKLVSVSPQVGTKGTVDPQAPVVVSAVHGKLTDVTVSTADGRLLPGSISADDRSWHSTGELAPGQHYTVRVSADNGDGGRGTTERQFATAAAGRLLTAELTPGDHAVYGVGEPVAVALSQPVHDPAARRLVEAGLTVDSTPSVRGAWYWVDDKTLHFRPEDYWPTHASVTVAYDLSGRHIQGDLYGGAAGRIAFSTGDKLLALTDADSDYMTVYRNGQEINSIPVTTGKPGFDTRNGIKVVLEQEPEVLMDSSTIGIAPGSSNSFHLHVRWDTRVTWSGEYVHAAPWSVGSQGVANVSHGCTGMSTANAEWFYDTFRRGDLVRVVNSRGHDMEPFGNGFGDWNLSWSAWQQGSALHRVVRTAPVPTSGGATQAGLIRPHS